MKSSAAIRGVAESRIEGSFEWEQTTKTVIGNTIKAFTRLNQSDSTNPKDVTKLSYTMRWLQKTDSQENWWFYPGQNTAQNQDKGKAAHVRLKVFNANGKLIATLEDTLKTPGNYEVEWKHLTLHPEYIFTVWKQIITKMLKN